MNKPSDVDKIAELLQRAKEAEVAEIEAEIPFFWSSVHNGKLIVRAVWRK